MLESSSLGLRSQESGRLLNANQKRMKRGDWLLMPTGARAGVVFVLGRPGSGKSTIAETLKADTQGRKVRFFDDYGFLLNMAKTEQRKREGAAGHGRFRLLMAGGMPCGFEVLDFSVLELVLRQMNARMCQHLLEPDTIILVELARDEYLNEHVWKYFSPEVRMSAHYLFCDAGLEVCVERVNQRPQRITPEIMREYYGKDGLPSLLQSCGKSRVEVVRTGGTLSETKEQVRHSLNRIMRKQMFGIEHGERNELLSGGNGESSLAARPKNHRKATRKQGF